MRYCYNCGWITPGEPRFCHSCGRSYDVKLCPRLHRNPRQAEVCSECGSRELTTPQPKVPLWTRLLLFLLSVLPGIVLLLLSALFLIAFVSALSVNRTLEPRFALGGLAIALLWLIYIKLPRFVWRSMDRRRMKAGRSFWKP